MEFSVTTLGTASALPTVGRYPSAHVFNIRGRLFLIDCGEGCQMLMRKYRFPILKFDCIFISHLHGDHIFGLFGLLSSMAMMGRTADLKIFAPKEFDIIRNFFIRQFGEGVKYNIIHIPLESSEPELIFQTNNLEVSAFPLNHRIPTFGFLFKEKVPSPNIYKEVILKEHLTLQEIGSLKSGLDVVREDGTILENSCCTYKPFIPRSFAYCCDSAPFHQLQHWIKNVDLLYHEATFSSELASMAETTFHSTAIQTAQLAVDAHISKLIIGHFSSRYKDLNPLLQEAQSIFPDTELAIEGKTFTIDLKNE